MARTVSWVWVQGEAVDVIHGLLQVRDLDCDVDSWGTRSHEVIFQETLLHSVCALSFAPLMAVPQTGDHP